MAHGQVAESKKKVMTVIPKTLAEKIEFEASKQGRSVSNYIAFVLEKELNKTDTRA